MDRISNFIQHDPGGSHYLKAEIWGDWSKKISGETLVHLWESKDRDVPTAVMASIAIIESALRPYVFRYESGMHELRGGTEFGWTSGGLFQILGMNLQGLGYSDWNQSGVIEDDVLLQMDMFNDFFYSLYKRAVTLPIVLISLYNPYYITACAYNTGQYTPGVPYGDKFLKHYRNLKNKDSEEIKTYLNSVT
jgi:hypothetical protein